MAIIEKIGYFNHDRIRRFLWHTCAHNSFLNKNIRACNVVTWWLKQMVKVWHFTSHTEKLGKYSKNRLHERRLSLLKIMGLNSGRNAIAMLNIYIWRFTGKEIRPSRIWNLIMPYSEQTRIRPEAANYAAGWPVRGRITYYLISRCRCLRVWSCVFFAIAQQYNFVAIWCIGHNTSSLEFIALGIYPGFIFAYLDYSLFAL